MSFALKDLLLPYQKRFVENKSKRKVWISARQIGKSFTLSYILSKRAIEKDNNLCICVSTGARSASEIILKCKKFAQAI